MQKSKVIFLSLLFAVIGIMPAIANNNPSEVSNEIRSEISSLVKTIDLNLMESDEEKVNVEFMVIANNEIVVLNISDTNLEYVIKERLNYKKLGTEGIVKNKIYFVPLVFKKV
jgi:hypothetical protein